MKDIEVFILTRNRADLLSYSLESILNQTHKVKVTVVDNNSSDLTEKYITDLMSKYPNLNYYRQDKFVKFRENFGTAKSLAKAEYVMFFHDDDILHPQYIEAAYKLVNTYDNVDLVCGLLTTFKDQSEINHKVHKEINYSLFNNKKEFVSHIYSAFFTDDSSIMFPHVIYKTENVKPIPFQDDLYGKIADKPFVLDAIKNGKCIQIRNKDMLMYRIHPGQDTNNISTGPYPNEVANHNKKFKDVLNNSLFDRIKFNVFSDCWLKGLYGWGMGEVNRLEFRNFIKEAYYNETINKWTYNAYFSPFRFIYKRLNKIMRKIFKTMDKKINIYSLVLKEE